jgi:ADP-heptose:LPS heptosyltransferase
MSILIVHQGALGDLILSLPALYSMRLYYGDSPWTMAGNPETLSLLHGRFYAREVISFHQKEWAGLFQQEALIPDRFQHYLSSFQKTYLFSKRKPEILTGGLIRAGLKEVLWMPSLPDGQEKRSLQSLQKEILESENIPWVETDKTIFPTPEDLREAEEYLGQTFKSEEERPLWALQPGSGSPHKNWPLERFLEVARKLLSGRKAQPLFLVGPVEREISPGMVRTIEALGFPVLKNLTLPVLAGVLSHCSGYIGNDSGVSHLAAALGLRTVVLFGPTDPLLWSPPGKKVRVLWSSPPCFPCSREIMQACTEKKCLKTINVQQVLEAIQNPEIGSI